jgi:hypothetical protein
MAVDTAIIAQSGAPALLQKVQAYQRNIDFSVTNLASGDHFELFDLEAGDVIIGGSVEVTTAGTGNHDLTLGIGGTGTELMTALPVDTLGVTVLSTPHYAIGDDTVDLAMTVAAGATGAVLVTLVVMKGADFRG